MDERDNFDEFDEFKRFDRSMLNRLFRQRMEDEEFKDRFSNILGNYERDMDKFMEMVYGSRLNENPLITFYTNLLKGLENMEDDNKYEDEGWKGKTWTSPDGNMSISSFTKTSGNTNLSNFPFFGEDVKTNEVNEDDMTRPELIEMLKQKMKVAVENEKYEEAANLRDSIKKIKEEIEGGEG